MPERDLEQLLRPRTAGVGLDVFAVEDSSAQVTWSDLPPGEHRLVVGDRSLRIDADGGPGSMLVDRLEPDTYHDVSLRNTTTTLAAAQLRTLRRARGERLARIATVSDLHLGRGGREYRSPLAVTSQAGRADLPPQAGHGAPASDTAVDHQLLCARAAIDEALEWGAELLVIKGDLCEETYDRNWDQAAELLGPLPVPVVIIPGNHDTGSDRHFEPEEGAASRGMAVTRGVDHVDVDGLRVVLADSTVPGSGWGSIARHRDAVAELARDADGGVLIATHHQPQRFAIPLYWPHGIPGPDARRFARAVTAANPSVLATSGHTHRCRRRRVAGMDWTEVAATNHFPGVWAGYTVHEGGISQTVRRIARPDALAWSESTRDAFGGVWALWATGELSDRCFTLDW